jgi:protein-S-isoprenylcysteine O-methyltransferase Ste14
MITWRNLPIPEPFVVALAAGGLLQIFVPVAFLPPSAAWLVVGSILILAGLVVAIWAAWVAGDDDLEQPASLLTQGPYAFSRNPMYLGWASMALGLAVLLNSLWLAVAALLASIYLHTVTIPREEQELQRTFGAEYQAYRRRVRRWL